jgi:hypothetical protein
MVGVRCATSRNRIIGLILFDYSINSEHYYDVILYPFIEHLNKHEIATSYLQQNGGAAYTARVSMTLLMNVFGDRITSKDIRPPRSAELTVSDYHL